MHYEQGARNRGNSLPEGVFPDEENKVPSPSNGQPSLHLLGQRETWEIQGELLY